MSNLMATGEPAPAVEGVEESTATETGARAMKAEVVLPCGTWMDIWALASRLRLVPSARTRTR